MFVLVTVACQACALADYFHPPNADRPTLTIASPCPGGTRAIADGVRTVTCREDEQRAVRISFDERGRVESYITLVDQVRSGVSQRWDATGTLTEEAQWRDDKLHGVRRVYGQRRVLVLEEHWANGVREGSYKQVIDPRLAIEGTYRAGERSGPWREWHRDRHATGNYHAGRRVGQWKLAFDERKALPDYVVSFSDDGVPVEAETYGRKYQRSMLIAEGALLAVGLVGHFTDRPAVEYGAGAALLAAGPLVHLFNQPSGFRLGKVVFAGKMRLIAPFAAFAVYSVGKLFAAIECEQTEYSPRTGDACVHWGFNYDTKYDVDLLKLGTAVIIMAADYGAAYRTTKATVREAWPTLGVAPTNGGAEVTLGGRF